MFPFVAYHGLSAADHQTRVDVLAPRGFRPTSLSVSGAPADARYAAVWQQRPGPAWVAVHGLNASQYQARFDTLTGEGFAPILVSATGGASDAIFAAVFENGVSSPWYARHGLSWDESAPSGSVNFENQRALDQGYIPFCLCVYGNPGDERFAGIWVKNDKPVPWSWWWTDPNIYQHFFDAEVDAGTRPAYLSVAQTHWMLSIFRDEPIGEWFARHGLTASQYQSEFDTRNAEGLEPLVVQAGGIGNSTRYASVFGANETPIARQWRVMGASFAGASELDATVKDFMTAHAIRAMTVAVARKGKLVANRAYTWAEPSYPITQPNTLFRVASVSKIFTCAAIDRLVSSGALTFATQAFRFLGITSKLLSTQTPDPDVGNITVGELAIRRSGLRRDFGDLRAIAGLISSSVTPTRDQLVRYVYGEPLWFRPGGPPPADGTDGYSNSAFAVLTSIVEAASHQSYIDYLRNTVLSPLGISDVHLGATRSISRQPHEVSTYDHPGVSPSLLDMAANAIAADAYGGQVLTENSEGIGGLIMSTGTVARFIAAHSVWDIGGREVATRYGEMDGTGAGAVSRDDGLDFSYAFNRRVTTADHDFIKGKIDSFLNIHGPSF